MRSPELQAVVELLRAVGPLGPSMPLAEQRAAWEALGAQRPAAAGTTVRAGTAGGVPVEWVTPTAAADDGAVICYFHGGGYAIGSPATHRAVVSELVAATGIGALVVDYRLAPEHRFPAAVDDAVAAYRYLLAQGHEARRVALVGDSAGGGLALAAAVSARDDGGPLPGALVCLSPLVDLTLSGPSVDARAASDPVLTRAWLEWVAAGYLGATPASHPLASPLFAELAGLPPLLVVVGTDEVLYDDATRLVDRAARADGDVEFESFPGAIHLWMQLAPDSPEAHAGLSRVAGYLRGRLGVGG